MPVHNTANMETWAEHVARVHETNAEHAAHHAAVAARALENAGRPDAIQPAGDTPGGLNRD